jgi:6-phosphogluconolactonase
LTFSKDGKYIYLLHELDGTVSVIRYQDGKLKFINENTVARKSNIKTGAADIHISPDGNFLYATNRGSANDITCFAIEKDAKLRFVEQISVEGISPRNFSITKDGRYILVANQRSNQIVVFKRDKKSGKLIDTDIRVDVGAPVCIQEY